MGKPGIRMSSHHTTQTKICLWSKINFFIDFDILVKRKISEFTSLDMYPIIDYTEFLVHAVFSKNNLSRTHIMLYPDKCSKQKTICTEKQDSCVKATKFTRAPVVCIYACIMFVYVYIRLQEAPFI